jgi:hypothetical protein
MVVSSSKDVELLDSPLKHVKEEVWRLCNALNTYSRDAWMESRLLYTPVFRVLCGNK